MAANGGFLLIFSDDAQTVVPQQPVQDLLQIVIFAQIIPLKHYEYCSLFAIFGVDILRKSL